MNYPFRKQFSVTLGFWAEYHPDIVKIVGHKYHRGIDFKTPVGIDVHAVTSGVIEWSGEDRGLGIVIVEDNGNTWRYWHLSKIIKPYGYVAAGQRIGISGKSGISYGAHTHIELQKGNKYIDWLKLYKEENMSDWLAETEKSHLNPTLKHLRMNDWLKKPVSEKIKVLADVAKETKNLKNSLAKKKRDLWLGFFDKIEKK